MVSRGDWGGAWLRHLLDVACSSLSLDGAHTLARGKASLHADWPARKTLVPSAARGWADGPHLPVQVPQAVVEETAGEAPKAQVGAEARGAGQQGAGVHPGPLVAGNPGLQQRERTEEGQAGTLLRSEPEAAGG